MTNAPRPLVLSAPAPRTLDLIFTKAARESLAARYEIMEVEPEAVGALPVEILSRVRYVLGQPPLARPTIEAMTGLRCVLNVESNLLNNMPYDVLFARGIHVVTTGAVFAEPVAELGVAMALNLARGIVENDLAFRVGTELWGGTSNHQARLLSGADLGIIGFGDLGRALNRVLGGFRARIRVFDPWLPPSTLVEAGVEPASLDTVLGQSDFVFVVAAVTSDNRGFLDAQAFKKMRRGAAFILLSRADVVDFDALVEAAASGHLRVASDVFPEEPMPKDHAVRSTANFLRSAHRAGALDSAFKKMGDMCLEDMALMDRGLPPMRCKRAERETVARMRSRPVSNN